MTAHAHSEHLALDHGTPAKAGVLPSFGLGLPVAVYALVVASFAMGADEFIVAGVIEEIALALGVSLGAVGLLESSYALGVAIGAPLFVAIGSRLSRRIMLLVSSTVFIAGNLLSALGPTYEAILAGRLIAAMGHGAFFGIAAVFAAELVDPSRKGRAISIVFGGFTAATILGAPFGAAIGQALGWRMTFWSLVILGVIGLVGIVALVPRVRAAAHGDHGAHGGHGGQPAGDGAAAIDLDALDPHARAHLEAAGARSSIRKQLAAFRRPAVWLALVTTTFGYGGVFTSYTYMAPQLTDLAGFGEAWITPLFLLFGGGLFVGNLLGGRLADARLGPALLGTIGALALALFAMTVAVTNPVTAVLGLFAYGVAAFSVVAPLQLSVVARAGDAPDMASAANISAFTLGSALGIWLGGQAIDAGLGLASVNWVGGSIALAGLVLAAVSVRSLRSGGAGTSGGQAAHRTTGHGSDHGPGQVAEHASDHGTGHAH
ncbi:MAG TPA: MFS transporter [Candidatus Limnocylindrales bacterium]|nr:MFS transporter [Candidatus Limnocylindrales bacterium]